MRKSEIPFKIRKKDYDLKYRKKHNFYTGYSRGKNPNSRKGCFRKGYHHSEESKMRISETQRRIGNKPPSREGKKHSEESKLKMSQTRIKRYDKIGRITTKERLAKLNKIWKKNHYDRVLFLNNRRRVRKEKVGGYHTFGEWEALKAQYNWTCLSCKKKEPEIKLTEDHIVPLNKGGLDNIENIQPLCKSCNCKKYTKIIKYV
jgi:5-methylcytosine-specific restriction endonuclease McrA